MKRIVQLGLLSSAILANTVNAGTAVSDENVKLQLMGGSVDGVHTETASFALAVPAGENFGLQLDGLYGVVGEADVRGGGLHAFWRDSEKALVGLVASYAEADDIAVTRAGIEAEYYHGKFTVTATGGHQDGDIEESGYGTAEIRYYHDDNLVFTIGGSKANDSDLWGGSIEKQLGDDGLSIFIASFVGNEGYDYTVLGVNYYFGEDKSLIRRHREDDPIIALFSSMVGSAKDIVAAAGGDIFGGNVDPCDAVRDFFDDYYDRYYSDVAKLDTLVRPVMRPAFPKDLLESCGPIKFVKDPYVDL